jgi:hypothetical protein
MKFSINCFLNFLSFRAIFCFNNPDELPPPFISDWRESIVSGQSTETLSVEVGGTCRYQRDLSD